MTAYIGESGSFVPTHPSIPTPKELVWVQTRKASGKHMPFHMAQINSADYVRGKKKQLYNSGWGSYSHRSVWVEAFQSN